MTRSGKGCRERGCPNLQPCADHPVVAWAGSKRSERTMSGSRQQSMAKACMELHDGICHVCSRPGADEVDHVIPLSEGGADDMANRRPIHSRPCHVEKTQGEARRGRL